VTFDGILHVVWAGFIESRGGVVRCHSAIIRQISSELVSSVEGNTVWQDDVRVRSQRNRTYSSSYFFPKPLFAPSES
jgi:hypothetical protein